MEKGTASLEASGLQLVLPPGPLSDPGPLPLVVRRPESGPVSLPRRSCTRPPFGFSSSPDPLLN